jgi:hypothetical protein
MPTSRRPSSSSARQALTADERFGAVANGGADVKAERRFLHPQTTSPLRHLANDANIDARFGALLEQPDHLRIRSPSGSQMTSGLPGPLDERRQLLPGVFRAHDKPIDARLELLAQHISIRTT